MKKKVFILCVAIIMALSCVLLSSCQKEVLSDMIKMPVTESPKEIDGSIPIMLGDSSDDVTRQNINRGFRYETYFTLGSGNAWPGDGIDGFDYLDDMLAYYNEIELKEIQVYIYLTEYKDIDIDYFALQQLYHYFNYIKHKNMSMILRFAYEPDQDGENAPTQKQMLKNIAILKTWIQQNIDLWYSTVTVHQIGHVGAWGEFGSSRQKYDHKKIVNAVCDMTPEKTFIQCRYMRVAKLVDKKYFGRIGYHNDFLVGRPHPWNTAGGDNDSKQYQLFSETNRYRLNDGEMPWAGATEEPNEYVDGKNLIKQLYEHHMTTLSIEHNYREFIKGGTKPKEHYNIMRYKSEYLSLETAKSLGIPYYKEYFTNSDGQLIERSIFEYIQDFLGYRLVMSNLKVETQNSMLQLDFMITNFGFAAPLNIAKAEVVYTVKGKEYTMPLRYFEAQRLTTYGQNEVSIIFPKNVTPEKIGIRFITNGGQYIATANENPNFNSSGINYLPFN